MKKCISITSGDFNGIGPEIVFKSLQQIDLNKTTPVWHINNQVFEYYSGLTGIDFPIHKVKSFADIKPDLINILDTSGINLDIKPGEITKEAGAESMRSISEAIEYCLTGVSDAMVTAPISKEAISLAGYKYPGHTEYLAEKTSTSHVVMMLVSGSLRVIPATIHIPISQVSVSLKKHRLIRTLHLLNNSLLHDFNLKNPSIGVLGLNPHAGDGGIIGREEIEIIKPVLKKATQQGINVEGPFSADGYFGNGIYQQYDATLSMYHDQGLIPFKALTFGSGVNYTAGLPIIRTSPDHGTAFSIAGKNIADERSLIEAYELAITLSKDKRN